MSGDLRRDPLGGTWTVIAPGRLARPHDAGDAAGPACAPQAGAGPADSPASCPFCEGHESQTPPEVDAFRAPDTAPDTPGWRVRVVPNKFPVIAGGHEVIVHSPRHGVELAEQPLDELADVVRMYQRRIAALCAGGAAAVTVILNQGGAAGASLAHPHSQVLATPIVPPVLAAELDEFARYHDEHDGRCLLCDLVARTIASPELLVFDGPIVAWAPDASRFPYELRLAPAAHEPDFAGAEASAAAGALRRALAALAVVTDRGPFNMWLHTAPCAGGRPFHWHLDVAPRLATLAGFELGAGIGIDLVEPRDAAALLRDAVSKLDEPTGGSLDRRP